MNIETIHNSLVNGQRKQMVEQIEEYGLMDFWNDYIEWLEGNCFEPDRYMGLFNYFTDATISYFRIKGR